MNDAKAKFIEATSEIEQLISNLKALDNERERYTTAQNTLEEFSSGLGDVTASLVEVANNTKSSVDEANKIKVGELRDSVEELAEDAKNLHQDFKEMIENLDSNRFYHYTL